MYYKIIKIVFCCLIFTGSIEAQVIQKAGDSPFAVNRSAVFELESKTKGFLPPRMTSIQRDAIVSPASGLTIFNVTSNALEVNEGSELSPIWSSVRMYLPLAGGVMTGDIKGVTLTLNNDAGSNSTILGSGSTTGAIILGGTGSQSISIGADAGLKTLILGSLTGTSSTDIQSGSGGLKLNPAANGVVLIGNSSGTGSITLGSSTNSQIVNIGAGTGSSTVNLATASGTNLVNIGGSLGASATSIHSGSGGLVLDPGSLGGVVIGNVSGEGTISLGSSTGSQIINLGTGTGASTVNIATGSTVANSITLGGTKSLVSVGEAPLESSAAFSVNSTKKGVLPPRMTTTERDAIVSPAEGLIVYNKSTKLLEVNTGTPAVPIWSAANSSISYPGISNRLTADYTVTKDDSTILFNASAGDLTVTLPAASTLKGKIFCVRKDEGSSNLLTISPALMLSGSLTTVALNYARTIKVQSNGSYWVVIN
ncbi:hypothetical protein ACHRVZ_15580 [Flavobacterium sp. FlaQc-57]|uniref:hypothetical protein n=1 Tax=Flavobacterium sp. FlaQc-57 TaxID=3374186 RepID=UPI0037582640